MTNSSIIAEIRNELNTNSTKVSDTYLVDGINLDDAELVMLALSSSTDHNFKLAESYTDFLSSSGVASGSVGFNGEYPFPSDLIKPLRVEISYDGVDWVEATVYDIQTSPAASEHNQTQVQESFSSTNPYVRFERDSYFVRPLKTTAGNISAGIHIWYEKRQTAFAVGDITTDIPSIDSNFHRLYVARGALRVMRKFRNDYGERDRLELNREINKLEGKFVRYMTERFKKPLKITANEEVFA